MNGIHCCPEPSNGVSAIEVLVVGLTYKRVDWLTACFKNKLFNLISNKLVNDVFHDQMESEIIKCNIPKKGKWT